MNSLVNFFEIIFIFDFLILFFFTAKFGFEMNLFSVLVLVLVFYGKIDTDSR